MSNENNNNDETSNSMTTIKSQIENEIEDELNSRKERLKRTLGIWNKLQDRIENILDSPKTPSSAMLTAISKTLIDQLKIDRQSLEGIAKELNKSQDWIEKQELDFKELAKNYILT